jgi:hypothetical protein
MKRLGITLSAVGAILILTLVWYLASPFFIDVVVNEELVFDGAPITVASSSFADADAFHKVSGTATISEDNSQRILRFEDFEATNGPDLKVYLATDESAKDFVSLGDLKGNVGSQNYVVSADTDLTEYDTILIWCEQFGVLFGSADISR